MSPSVEEIRKAAEARMRELGPVIEEIAQLRQILQVTSGGEGGPDLVPAGNGEISPTPRRGPGGRAPRGSNKATIMAMAREHPGIAAPEIAALTELKRDVVSATMYRLKKQGALEDYGKGVRVAAAPARQRRFILELAEAKPGVTPGEIAVATGLDPVVAAVTVEAMEKKGELEPAGGGVAVPSAG